MATLYQWTVPCIICEDPAEFHCNTCGDVLCPRCKANHLKSNATRQHDIVPYSQRSVPVKNNNECEKHPGHLYNAWCKTCNKPACTECMLSEIHNRHSFAKFEEKIMERRQELQKELDVQSDLLATFESKMLSVQRMRNFYEKEVQVLSSGIGDQADKICKEVRAIENKTMKKLHDLSSDYQKKSTLCENAIKDDIKKCRDESKELEAILRSSDSTKMLTHKPTLGEVKRDSIQHLKIRPIFKPGDLSVDFLEKMFGNFSEVRKEASKTNSRLTSSPGPKSDASIMISRILTANDLDPAIACVDANHAWIETSDNILKLFARDGTVKSEISFDFSLRLMTVSGDGDLMLCDFSNKCIRCVPKGSEDMSILFYTETTPHDICCLSSDEILVTSFLERRMTIYNRAGDVIKEMDNKLFRYPFSAAQHKESKLLYVTDKKGKQLSAAGRLVCFGMDGKRKFQYSGRRNAEFTPCCVSIDGRGFILVANFESDSVHILSQELKFLQYLTAKNFLRRPVCIDTDGDGHAWVGEDQTHEVNIVKYHVK